MPKIKNMETVKTANTNDIPNHKKASCKNNKKSNHKHVYKECYILHENAYFSGKNRFSMEVKTYCPICGKLGYAPNVLGLEEFYDENGNKFYRQLTPQEQYDKYGKLPVFVASFLQRHVDLNNLSYKLPKELDIKTGGKK